MQELLIRRFRDSDAIAAAKLFFEAVQTGAKDAYTQEQRDAWAPSVPDVATWRDRMAAQFSVVACQDDILLGFMTLTDQGIIDLAFVHPKAMGTGIAGKLYEAIITEAKNKQLINMQTRASHLARRFFEKRNWRVLKQQTIVKENVELTNFLMQLTIRPEESQPEAKDKF